MSSEYNLLAQTLPETLGRLSNLQQLLLDRNMYPGNIPVEFGLLSQLGKLKRQHSFKRELCKMSHFLVIPPAQRLFTYIPTI